MAGNDNLATTCNVSFAVPPATEIVDSQDSILASEASSLAKELFGEGESPATPSTWNHMVLDAIQTEFRKGLSQDVRVKLLAKYEIKDDLAALAPPKLNKELASALTQSVVKRDEHQLLAQSQVSACLNAFGSGISLLLKPEVAQSLDNEVRSALTLFSEGIHLLADHQYRLSIARRAFTKPSLNITGKNAADSAAIDDFLFGQNFAETLKAAQICEKTGREVSKPIPQVGKKTLQPVRGTLQQQKQPYIYNNKPHRTGNWRTPVRAYAARRTGDRYHKNRPHISQSRSRNRRRL
ncbi:hypothetical protein ALC57_01487 [Trachymyrmex cornetzi]|uniref:Uncharacterized protein n=1 Tax=Trachymyrmex cornetzi TaxID=471704 RepID=A0A151JPN0_9HYME|nr:hypothetical protein ALC57_01487 [Trachymyrmex cornetzi]